MRNNQLKKLTLIIGDFVPIINNNNNNKIETMIQLQFPLEWLISLPLMNCSFVAQFQVGCNFPSP